MTLATVIATARARFNHDTATIAGVRRPALLVVATAIAAVAGCGGGGGTIGVAPGVSGLLSASTPAPTPTAPPGAVALGTPAFPQGNASGDCTRGITFNTGGLTAVLSVSEPNYTGTFTIASNSSPNVATASVTGSTVTVTALAAGTTTIVVPGDSHGATASCAVGVTITNGSVQ